MDSNPMPLAGAPTGLSPRMAQAGRSGLSARDAVLAARSAGRRTPVEDGSTSESAATRSPIEPVAQIDDDHEDPKPPKPPKRARGGPKKSRGQKAQAAVDKEPLFSLPWKRGKQSATATEVDSASADGAKLTLATRWGGDRRKVLLRRFLVGGGCLSLIYIAATVGGKASSSDIDTLVAEAVGNASTSFPTGDATVWAAPVVKLFATYEAARAAERSTALAPYIAGGLDPQLGWNGGGAQKVVDMVVNPAVTDIEGGTGTVHASVQIEDGSWRCIAVPIYSQRPTDGGKPAFGLSAVPVYEPCAGVTIPPRDTGLPERDDTLAKEFSSTLLPSFMGAWLSGDTTSLPRYVLPGHTLYGLGGAFTGAGEGQKPAITEVIVPAAAAVPDAARRTVTFTATLLGLDGRAQQRAVYDVDVAEQNSQWFIASDPRPGTTYSQVGGESLPTVKPTAGPQTSTAAGAENTHGR